MVVPFILLHCMPEAPIRISAYVIDFRLNELIAFVFFEFFINFQYRQCQDLAGHLVSL